MKNQLKFLSLACFFAIVSLIGCQTTDSIEPATGVGVGNSTTLGSILTDNKGQTLYIFAKDVDGKPNCVDGCEKTWPIFYVETPTLINGLVSADFTTVTRPDGSKQTAYKGYPLYYYSPTQDGKLENVNETKGDGVNNVWFVAKSNYTVMFASRQLLGHDGRNYTAAAVEGTGESSYLVDANGRTLYTFNNDTKNNNNFTAANLSNNTVWPLFNTTLADFPTGLKPADFGTIDVFGQKQITYKGRPLYYFGGNSSVAGDQARGETRGVSFPSPGVWPIATSNLTEAPASITATQNATFGKILTDSKGRTLYFFARDTDKTNRCTGGCVNIWPVFYTDVLTVSDASFAVTDFDVITLTSGAKQTTYKGWPLYYYSPTANGTIETAGSTAGNGVGSVWFVAKSTYTLMVANAQLVGDDAKNYTSAYVEGAEITQYFVDGSGRTIYRFTRDTKDKNTFTAANLSNNTVWPIFYSAIADLPSTMNKADFGEITVFGQKQLTFKGWPLYYFGKDTQRIDNRGVSVPSPGVWPVVNNTTIPAQ